MSDNTRDPYGRPRDVDPLSDVAGRSSTRLSDQGADSTWAWIAGVIVLALIVGFIAFGRSGADNTASNAPATSGQRMSPPAAPSAPSTTPSTPNPAPKSQ